MSAHARPTRITPVLLHPTMTRLSAASLHDLAPDVGIPEYDRRSVVVDHAHLGVGNFHRAHQAVYSDDLLKGGSRDGAIVGFSMRSRRVADALAPQDLLYSVVEAGAQGTTRVVGSITEMMDVLSDPRAAIARLADPTVERVTITVTEDGYCWSDDERSIDMTNPHLVHDLSHPDSPRTMPGLIVAALARRLELGAAPFVVIPCDNIIDNGEVTREVLASVAAHWSPQLSLFVTTDLEICSTMVDRMVPGTTDEMKELARASLGVDDVLPIVTEPFRQWVVQDHPAVRRWGEVGVELVADTRPHERLKLHVLNGLHSTLAYIGLRLGHELISDTVADATLMVMARRILDEEILPCVHPPSGVDAARYARSVLERFAEPTLGYTTTQVASGGALKLQQRILPTIRSGLDAGGPVEGLTMVIAAWGWAMFGPERARLAVEDEWLSRKERPTPEPKEPAEFAAWAFTPNGLLAEFAGVPELEHALARQATLIWGEPPLLRLDRDLL